MAIAALAGRTSASRANAAKRTEEPRNRVPRVVTLLKQASDPTRLQLLSVLADGERHVGALCDDLGLGQPAVSHHLALLRHGGLVAPRRQGKNTIYALTETGEALAAVVDALMASRAVRR